MAKMLIYKPKCTTLREKEVKIRENGVKKQKTHEKWCKCTFIDPKSAQKSI